MRRADAKVSGCRYKLPYDGIVTYDQGRKSNLLPLNPTFPPLTIRNQLLKTTSDAVEMRFVTVSVLLLRRRLGG